MTQKPRPVTVVPPATRAGKGPAPQGQGKPATQLPRPANQSVRPGSDKKS
jgi:hypothetical protein